MINLSDPAFSDPYIPSRPWVGNRPPRRILAIRLQATGDTVITLPYLQDLRRRLPVSARLDFLTREETASIPRSLRLFDRIFVIRGKRNFYKQLLFAVILVPILRLRRYDVVIDLQNNLISRMIRKSIAPKSWSVFDKRSPRAAGERTRLTIEASGLGATRPDTDFVLRQPRKGREILLENGWDGHSGLVVLNPAAAFVTRNWPLQRYVEFSRQWRRRFPDTQFILLGTRFIAEKSAYLLRMLDNGAGIDLVGNTSPSDAFSVLQHVSLVLSEDSGLMHMAWVSGIPTMALFGGSRSDWARPLGPHAAFLDSRDVVCAPCMLETCPYGDVHCMSGHSVTQVLEQCLRLVDDNGLRQGPYAGL
jgi:ADP-heptose:LPS heptosyltransferase